MMNKKAKELNLDNTHFVTPHGLDSEGHYTTAYELALISDYGLRNEKFKEIVSTKNYNVKINNNVKNIRNTNELLGNLEGVYGVKTGFTNGANRCLVTATKRGNLDIICVVLGADTKKIRTSDSIKLIEYAFKEYDNVNLENIINDKFKKYKEDYINSINVIKGIDNKVEYELGELKIKNMALTKDEQNKIEVIIHTEKNIEAPVEKNKQIGTLQLVIDGDLAQEINIYTSSPVKRKNIFDYMKIFLRKR